MKQVRVEARWTQEQLAAAVDVTPNTISRFENGHLSLRISTIAAIAEALGVTLGDLTDVTRPVPTGVAPPEDEEIVRLFHSLDDSGRALATSLVREVAKKGYKF